LKILIVGGGTAGHINPGIALAKMLVRRRPDCEILFVGTEKGMESRIVPREGFSIEFIRVSGYKRSIGFGTIKTFIRMFEGFSDAKEILKRYNPDVVVGMGGYVCGPMLMAAYFSKIPTLIHEQNALPGVTNKILSRFVNTVCISYEDSRKYFKSAKNIEITGNPIREEFMNVNRKTAREKIGLDPGEKLVTIMGGSLGSEKINDAVLDMLENYFQKENFKVLFATGVTRYKEVMERFMNFKTQIPDSVIVESFITDTSTALAAADLAICRAGAITLAELAYVGTPVILIPSPNVAANHQEYNARVLEKNGAAIVLTEKELSGESLSHAIHDLITNYSVITRMGKQINSFSKPDASKLLALEVLKLVQK